MTTYKPTGYTSASPYLLVSDAASTVAFLTAVFGATVLHDVRGDDGRCVHAEVRIDDTVVMLADAVADWPPVPAHVHVYVEDVDATYARAISAGGRSVQVPQRKDDGNKRGGVQDSGGTTWWISTAVEEGSG